MDFQRATANLSNDVSPVSLNENETLRELPLVLDPASVFFLGGLTTRCLLLGDAWISGQRD